MVKTHPGWNVVKLKPNPSRFPSATVTPGIAVTASFFNLLFEGFVFLWGNHLFDFLLRRWALRAKGNGFWGHFYDSPG